MTKAFILSAGVLLLCCSLTQPGLSQETSQEPRKYVLDLRRKLSDSDDKVRADAARSLRNLAVELHSMASPVVMRAMDDRDPAVRRAATAALVRFEAYARNYVDVLIGLLEDPDEGVRLQAVQAVAATSPFSKAGIPRLITLIRSKDVLIRRSAIAALGKFGLDSAAAIPVLIEALDDPDPGIPSKVVNVKQYAMEVLGKIDPAAPAAANGLKAIEKLGDAKVRGLTAEEFRKLLPQDRKLLPVLTQVLKNRDCLSLRWSAACALGTLQEAAADAVPDLLYAISAEDVQDPQLASKIKVCCVWALGEMGPAAYAASPLLRHLAQAAQEPVRGEAARALKKIREPQQR